MSFRNNDLLNPFIAVRDVHFSTKRIHPKLVETITKHLQGLDYGSVELCIVDHVVTQITRRQTIKTGPDGQTKSADRTRRHRS